MKHFVFICLVGIVLMYSLFLVEELLIPKLSDSNRFKKWWRNNVIGSYEGNDF